MPKKEEEEQISGGMLEANLLSRGVSGLYCLLVLCLPLFSSSYPFGLTPWKALYARLSVGSFVWMYLTQAE